MKIATFNGREPRLRLEDYFVGQTRAAGIFQDRFGKVRRQFQLEAEGTFDGETLTLVEDFTYDDGQTEQRIWRLRPTGEHGYLARTADVVGAAHGAAHGNAFHLDYRIALDLGARRMTVRFDDWMFLQPDGTLINRASVTKFGILLGQVTCSFRQVAAVEPQLHRDHPLSTSVVEPSPREPVLSY